MMAMLIKTFRESSMKRWRYYALAAVSALTLAGCAGPVIRSDVTVFHEWQNDLRAQPFVFERTKAQDNDLEYRAYENLVRTELQRVGMNEATPAQKPALTVKLNYGLLSRDVRIVQPVVVDPFFYSGPIYGPRWRRHRMVPFADPFGYAGPLVQYREGHQLVFRRELHVQMSSAANAKNVFDMTVHSDGTNGSLAAVMPYMVRSAFADFPGPSGVPRRIDMEVKE